MRSYPVNQAKYGGECTIIDGAVRSELSDIAASPASSHIRAVAIRDRLTEAGQREGHIYFIQAENGGPIKIGWSQDDPEKRLSSLQTGNPSPLRVLSWVRGFKEHERQIQDRFSDLHVSGEWFEDDGSILEFAGEVGHWEQLL